MSGTLPIYFQKPKQDPSLQRRTRFMTLLMQPHAYGSDAVAMATHNPPTPPHPPLTNILYIRWPAAQVAPWGVWTVAEREAEPAELHPGPCQTSCARWLCSWNLLCMTAQGTITQTASEITTKQAFMQHISHFLQQYKTWNCFKCWEQMLRTDAVEISYFL